MSATDTFEGSVITPERKVLECQARFAAFPAHDGEMGILSHRAPLVCKLGIGILRVEATGSDVSDGQQAEPRPGRHVLFVDGGFAQVVENTLTYNSSPLLLGYNVREWDFRVLFRGLIAVKPRQRQAKGLCIQVLRENNQELLELLGKYLENTSNLKIYKGSPRQCMLELEQIWRGEYG